MVSSNKFPLDKPDFKYLIGYKENKEIRPLCIFFPEISIYKRYSYKTKCIYFMKKDKQNFDKYMTVWEILSYIIKKYSSELIYIKKYLKAEKRCNTKENFPENFSYTVVILFNSVYRKDGNFYPEVFLETFIHNLFFEEYKKFRFLVVWKLLLKYKKVPIPKIYRIFSAFSFPEPYEQLSFEPKMFDFLKYNNFFNLGTRKFHSLKYKTFLGGRG